VALFRARRPSRSALGGYGLDDDPPPSPKAGPRLRARLGDERLHRSIVQQRWIVDRYVPHHCARSLEEPSRIMKDRTSEKEEIHPTRIENDR
jgi:hypothetical protein